MWRIAAGIGAGLLLCGAGFVWWSAGADRTPVLAAFEPAPARANNLQSPPAPPPAAEERTREEKRFDRYDKDRDDLITGEEYLANRRKAYARLDSNGDGRLSFDEWAAKTTAKFATADGDRSKSLSRSEFATTKVVRKSRPRLDCPPQKAEDDS